MDNSNAEKAWRNIANSGTASATWIAYSRDNHSGCSAGWLAEETLRLLASRDAEVAELLAQAWAEGFKQGGPMRDEDASDPDAHTRNPYRSKK